jgi:hypothetical protein
MTSVSVRMNQHFPFDLLRMSLPEQTSPIKQDAALAPSRRPWTALNP